jgi:hypothetical protein
MTLTNAGNVGIGTVSPDWMLRVEKNTSSASYGQYPAITVANSNASGYSAYYLFNNITNLGGIEYSNGESLMRVQSAGSMLFLAGGSERMRITSDGKLGVGRSSPRGRVEFVTGLPTSYPNMADTSNGVILSDGGAIGCRLGTADRTSASQGYPTYIQAGDLTTSTLYYDLRFNPNGGAVFAGSVRLDTLSDERVKDNIQPIQGALNKILSITGKKFHLKDEPEDKLRYGFIAQELEGILDEFVIQSDMTFKKDDLVVENVKSIENWASSWAALLVESIKEQQSQIESLKSENDTLKSILQRNNIS